MTRRKSLTSQAIILALVLTLCACTGLMQNVKPWADRTPKEKALAINEAYNSEFRDAVRVATDPTSTPAQLDVSMQKKAVLSEIWPLLVSYNRIVNGGGAPARQDEDQILELFNKLGRRIA